MTIKFGTDGIRGPVESEITPEVCLRIGHAAGVILKEMGWDTVLIGKDTRVSGYMLESALQAGFIAAGVNVRLLGPCLLYTSPSPRDVEESRMPSSA